MPLASLFYLFTPSPFRYASNYIPNRSNITFNNVNAAISANVFNSKLTTNEYFVSRNAVIDNINMVSCSAIPIGSTRISLKDSSIVLDKFNLNVNSVVSLVSSNSIEIVEAQ
jgi:hypothetical protein